LRGRRAVPRCDGSLPLNYSGPGRSDHRENPLCLREMHPNGRGVGVGRRRKSVVDTPAKQCDYLVPGGLCMKRLVVAVPFVALAVAAAGSWVASAQTRQQAPAQVTFTKDVMPILQRSCQKCHRPESMAPMSLMTYEDVRPWARTIKEKVSTREMP